MVTKESTGTATVREWLTLLFVALGLIGAGSMHYFGNETSAQSTATKVDGLTVQMSNLTTQVGELTRAMATAQVTASQVNALVSQMSELAHSVGMLSDKIGAMPRSDDVRDVKLRQDAQAAQIGDLQQKTSALGSVMETLQPKFRNTR